MTSTQFLTLFTDGIILGSITALLAVSFALIISVTQRFHIAYITSYAISAYGAIYANTTLGWPVVYCVIFGLVIATLLGVAIEAFVYRPLSAAILGRGANPLIPTLIASLGILTIGENLFSIHFNTSPTPFPLLSINALSIGSVRITQFDVIEVAVSWVIMIAIHVFLRNTQRGKWIVAVRSNRDLAATIGINVGNIFLLVFAIGTFCAGVLGLMYAVSTSATPGMGFTQVFEGFLIVFIAGIASSPMKFAVVGLVIGEITDLSQNWISSVFSQVLVMGVLFAYVIYRSVTIRHPELALGALWARVRPSPTSAIGV